MKELNEERVAIALYGFGTVARGFLKLLPAVQNESYHIKYLVVKHPQRDRNYPVSPWDGDPFMPLDDPELKVVIELTDDSEFSAELAERCLQKGLRFISANKKMLAHHLKGLLQSVEESGGMIQAEAAAAASIPIFRLASAYLSSEQINGFRAVLNGTSNFILSNMLNGSKTYEEALQTAQKVGFAESNPELDTEGYDPGYKMSLLAAALCGIHLPEEQIPFRGISRVRKKHVHLARSLKLEIRHVCEFRKVSGIWRIFCGPELISPVDAFAGLNDAENAIELDGGLLGKQVFIGKGAGMIPTGYAVLRDLMEASPTFSGKLQEEREILPMSTCYFNISDDKSEPLKDDKIVMEGEWEHQWVQVIESELPPDASYIRIKEDQLPVLASKMWHLSVQ